MILDIDIGNTRIKWLLRRQGGLDPGAGAARREQWRESLRTVTEPVSRVRVASVRGDIYEEFSDYCRRRWYITPEFAAVESGLAGLNCGYSEPAQLGVDRWLALLACWRNMGPPALVIDAGSAVTIDLLTAEGHGGGYIIPGLAMMTEALGLNTWGVRATRNAHPDTAPAANTSDAVNHGCLLALAGAVERVARAAGIPTVVVTGGDGALLRGALGSYRVVAAPELVLDGLAIALP